jgi:hypothetical protein
MANVKKGVEVGRGTNVGILADGRIVVVVEKDGTGRN